MTNHRGARRFFKTASIFSVILMTATLIAVSGASAASAKCQPGRTNDGTYYWDGWYRDSVKGGVYSDILDYSPWVQPGAQGVTAWTMLDENGASLGAQVGWWEVPYGSRHTFVRWSTSPGHWQTKFYTPLPTGSYSYYTTLWNNKPGYFSFEVNNTTIDTEVASFTPNQAQISGEIGALDYQMPGGYDDPEVFEDSHAYISGWGSFSGGKLSYNSNYFGNNIISTYTDEIWDWACQN